jgi:hypothetical protein
VRVVVVAVQKRSMAESEFQSSIPPTLTLLMLVQMQHQHQQLTSAPIWNLPPTISLI